uniref:Uncharacterized protein n=1 Tax=Gossypium raimondii TaxID=29730 RepID=A0A0D2MDK5_GOSRA|nr:hypothetical protein B456_002G203700 [Gossypium raimondii]
MSRIISPITDLSNVVDLHFLMTILESPIMSTELKPTEIPNFTSCKPACASVMNGYEIMECRTVFKAKTLPITPQTTRPEVDL